MTTPGRWDVWEMQRAMVASQDAMHSAGCHTVPDYFLALCSSSSSSSSYTHPIRSIYILAEDDDACWDQFASFSAERNWGVDALLFKFGEIQESLLSVSDLLLSLALIPAPFSTLFLSLGLCSSRTEEPAWAAFSTVLSSGSFTRLVLSCYNEHPAEYVVDAILSNVHLQTLYVQFQGHLRNNFFQKLSIQFQGPLTKEVAFVWAILTSHPTLSSLTFSNMHFSVPGFHKLFTFMETNLHLTSLSLKRCIVQDGWSRTLIRDCLRSHGTFHQLDLGNILSDAAIAAQLQKNEENAARANRLKSLGAKAVRPSTVRLYLCGLPFSGKTTLSGSLAKYCKQSHTSKFIPHWLPHTTSSERTRGIEVTIIESMLEQPRISVWDMAGQPEYHSFHDGMLPDLDDRAIPSLFLYVWNPFEVDTRGKVAKNAQGCKTRNGPEKFKTDFKYWLRFIASKTSKSQAFKPKMLVAITRADLGCAHVKLQLENSVIELQKEFEEYIQFDMEGVFEVDATNDKMLSDLASKLFRCAADILKEAPDTFKVCDEVRKFFGDWMHDKKIAPLISKNEFISLLQKFLGIGSHEMCEAVAHSLNSSGDLIYFSSLELVIIDTRWFCQKIMGDILRFDVKFPANEKHFKGFFPIKFLENLLEAEVSSWKVDGSWRKFWKYSTRGESSSKKSIKVSGNALVKLLMGLRLACPKDDNQENSEIFIPASLCCKARERVVPSNYLKHEEDYNVQNNKDVILYIGRRWKVKNSNCTFLTPGVFPLLQVTFHKIFTKREIRVDLDQDVIAFAFDSARVFVEFCKLEGEDNFIDVLVSSKHKTIDEGLEWLNENVTSEMKKVFADSRGVVGVEFAHFVIKPACIRRFVEASERVAVPVQSLQDRLSKHLQRKGAPGVQAVMHTWQTEPLEDETIVTLLGNLEVAKLFETYRNSLVQAAGEVLNLSIEEERPSERQKPIFGMSRSNKQREAMYDLLSDVWKDLKGDIMSLKGDMKRLADQVDGLRSTLLTKLCELFTYGEEGELGKLPRMFVITENVGIVRRVVSKVVPALHNLRLELLCECQSEPAHLVDGQRGLSIATLDDGLLKRGLPYIEGFLKVAYIVAKVGAHIAVGYGDVIPDFTRVMASVIDTDLDSGLLPTFSHLGDDWNSSSRVDFRNGQQWLFDVLSQCNCTTGAQIHAKFGLRRIRYDNLTVAWVCDKHYSGGKPWPA